MTHALFWIAAACALAYLPLSSRPASSLRTFLKTGSVALLAVIAATSGASALLIVALALCALGDALLSRETASTFMAGIGNFMRVYRHATTPRIIARAFAATPRGRRGFVNWNRAG